MTRAWTWIWGLTPTKPVFAKGVAATGVVQPVQSACSPCYLVCIVASRGDVREGFEGLREEADLESLGAAEILSWQGNDALWHDEAHPSTRPRA